jgi:hypothetical protein
MEKPQRRTRKLSNPNHRGSKKSFPNIVAKNVMNDKLRHPYLEGAN